MVVRITPTPYNGVLWVIFLIFIFDIIIFIHLMYLKRKQGKTLSKSIVLILIITPIILIVIYRQVSFYIIGPTIIFPTDRALPDAIFSGFVVLFYLCLWIFLFVFSKKR